MKRNKLFGIFNIVSIFSKNITKYIVMDNRIIKSIRFFPFLCKILFCHLSD